MTLTEFLLARIAEDEEQAHALIRRQRRKLIVRDAELGYVRAFDPNRVAAECEARRRIVEEHANWNEGSGLAICGVCHDYQRHDAERWPCPTLRLLALPYAGHPDYREEWKP